MVPVTYEASYKQSAQAVWEVLTSEAFLAAYAKRIGALNWEIGVMREHASTRTRLQMTVPTTGVPAAFKRFVTPTVDILEVRTWRNGEPSPSGDATVDAAVGKRAAHIRGALSLTPEDIGCLFSFKGDIRVTLPLVGDAAALLVKDLIRNVLSQQSKVLEEWDRD